MSPVKKSEEDLVVDPVEGTVERAKEFQREAPLDRRTSEECQTTVLRQRGILRLTYQTGACS